MMNQMLRAPSLRRDQQSMILPEKLVQNQRNELQRALEVNVTFLNEEFMRELWQNRVKSVND